MVIQTRSWGVRVFFISMLANFVGNGMAMQQAVQERPMHEESHSLATLSRGEIVAAVRENLNAHIIEERALDVTRSAEQQKGPFFRFLSDAFKDSAPLIVTALAQDDGSQLETAITAAGQALLFYVPQITLDIFPVTFVHDAQHGAKPIYFTDQITALAPLNTRRGNRLLLGTKQGHVRLFEPNKGHPLLGSVDGEVTQIVLDGFEKRMAVCFTMADGKKQAAIAYLHEHGQGGPVTGSALCTSFFTIPADRADVTDVKFNDVFKYISLTAASGEEEIWSARETKSGVIVFECLQGRR